jgi:hypothetical protein
MVYSNEQDENTSEWAKGSKQQMQGDELNILLQKEFVTTVYSALGSAAAAAAAAAGCIPLRSSSANADALGGF